MKIDEKRLKQNDGFLTLHHRSLSTNTPRKMKARAIHCVLAAMTRWCLFTASKDSIPVLIPDVHSRAIGKREQYGRTVRAEIRRAEHAAVFWLSFSAAGVESGKMLSRSQFEDGCRKYWRLEPRCLTRLNTPDTTLESFLPDTPPAAIQQNDLLLDLQTALLVHNIPSGSTSYLCS
jgi:hypothetical protein